MAIDLSYGLLNLAVYVVEELGRDEVEFVVDGSDDSLDGLLDGLNAGFEGAGALLGVGIEDRGAHHSLYRGELHEFKVLELLLLSFNNSFLILDLGSLGVHECG